MSIISDTSVGFGLKRRGLMLVMSSPSGAGKTTLSRMLLGADPEIRMSVSATTRPPRDGEKDGVDYFFVDHNQFEDMAVKDEFLEHATVFSNRYGTPKKPVEDALADGRDILFDIDWQGTQQLSQAMSKDLVSVFILPPSVDALQERLTTRGLDSAEVVAERMSKAADEMTHWAEYDYIIVNDDLDKAFAELCSILSAERLKRDRQKGLAGFVKSLAG